MSLGWCQVDEGLFALSVVGRDCARYQLIAERLPEHAGWDWTVWRIGDAVDAARHGDASSAAAAMLAAEGAVQHWDEATTEASPTGQLCN